MRIAVISDLHLGRGDQTDRGRGHDEALLRFLDYLEADHEMIVLLGDIWEMLTSQWPGYQTKEAQLVKRAHPEVAQRFATGKYHYIVGNHDRTMGILEDTPKELVLTIDQMKMIFTHGHQFDIWATRLRYISEFVVWFSGWASRLGTHSVTRFFDWFHNLITGTSEGTKLGTLESKLIAMSQQRGAQLTIIGHTHLPGIFRSEGHLLVNSGHCLCGTFHFVSIDTHDAEVGVYRVDQMTSDQTDEWDIYLIDSSKITVSHQDFDQHETSNRPT